MRLSTLFSISSAYYILMFFVVFFICCTDSRPGTTSDSVSNRESNDIEMRTNKTKTMLSRLYCNSVYTLFPFIVEDFDSIYGYSSSSTGPRYGHEMEDFTLLVRCLDECYDSTAASQTLQLGAKLTIYADAPMIYQSLVTTFFTSNIELLNSLLAGSTVHEVEEILRFFFAELPANDLFRPQLCSNLLNASPKVALSKTIRRECSQDH